MPGLGWRLADSLYKLISCLECANLMQSGCLVVNAPTANTIAAAEHGIALIAALSRNVAQADASVKAGKWERTKFVGVSIIGKTLAIMGFGKVCHALVIPKLPVQLSLVANLFSARVKSMLGYDGQCMLRCCIGPALKRSAARFCQSHGFIESHPHAGWQ